MPSAKVIENASFVFWVVAFIAVERGWPGKLPVDRRRDFKRDLLAFVVVSLGAALSRLLLLDVGHRTGLDSLLGTPALLDLGWPAKVALAIVFVDFGIYWVHRAMHASNLLWRTHRFHHSVEHLYWFSGLRTSVFHALLFAVPQVLFSFFILGFGPKELAAAAVIGLFFQFYIHSSIDLGLGPLDWLFVTPRFHRLHHARGETHAKNIGTMLTIWDRLFGTFVDPRTVPAPTSLGIDDAKPLARMVIGI